MSVGIRRPFFGPMREALASGPYRAWALGSLLSLTGVWAQRVAVAWLIWDQTGSTTWVAIGVSADLLPVVLVSPIAGILGDTFDRLTVVIWAQVLTVLAALLLCVTVWAGTPSILLMVAILAVGGVSHGIRQPSRMAMVRDLVSPQSLPAAIAIGSILYNLARFTGPATAGIVIATLGIEYAFVVSLLSAVVFLVILARIRRHVPRKVRVSHARPVGFIDGVTAAMSNPVTAHILLLQFANTVCIRSFSEILPGVSDRIFGMGVEGLAMLTTSYATGAVVSGLWLAQRPGLSGLYRVVVICNVLSASVLGVAAFVDVIFVAVVLMATLGMLISICSIGSQTMLQSLAPDRLLSRILATFGLVQWVGPALGALIIGALADRYGFPLPLLGSALVALAVAALLRFGYRGHRDKMP